MKVFIVAVIISVAAAKSVYPAPPAAPSYSSKSDTAAAQPESYPPQPYSFNWEVKDAESKNDYSHSESSDGKVVSGSYSIVLPDTRTQIVTYKSDDSTGYVADVQFQGEAKYPEPKQAAASYSSPAASTYPAPASNANRY